MCKEKIASSLIYISKKLEKSEKFLPGQMEKCLEVLEIRLELCIQKMEFLKQAIEKLKKEFTDLEMDWEKCLPGFREEILQLYETIERNK